MQEDKKVHPFKAIIDEMTNAKMPMKIVVNGEGRAKRYMGFPEGLPDGLLDVVINSPSMRVETMPTTVIIYSSGQQQFTATVPWKFIEAIVCVNTIGDISEDEVIPDNLILYDFTKRTKLT